MLPPALLSPTRSDVLSACSRPRSRRGKPVSTPGCPCAHRSARGAGAKHRLVFLDRLLGLGTPASRLPQCAMCGPRPPAMTPAPPAGGGDRAYPPRMGLDEDARSRIAERADAARAALVWVYDCSPPVPPCDSFAQEQHEQWITAQHRAKPFIEGFHSFAASVRRDRLARRMAQAWLDAAIIRWWDRCNDAAEAEAQAWSYLKQLTERRCPRSAPRQIRQQLDAITKTFLHEESDEVNHLVALSKALRQQQRGHGREP